MLLRMRSSLWWKVVGKRSGWRVMEHEGGTVFGWRSASPELEIGIGIVNDDGRVVGVGIHLERKSQRP